MMTDGFCYFDHNATMPMTAEARRLWVEAAESFPGNPSSPHRLGSRADSALEDARHRLGTHLRCDAIDLVWTSGATESNNQILAHLARSLRGARDREIWLSAVEHPCVLAAGAKFFPGRVRTIPVSSDGVVDLEWMERSVKTCRPLLVGVMAANNETGVLQPWQTIRDWCRVRDILFFCDAAQWIGKMPAAGLGECDFVAGCAHKFGGPPGVGFLKCRSEGPLTPLLIGGGQERGRRAGTENVPGVLSMVGMLDIRERMIAEGAAKGRQTWRAEFERMITKRLPAIRIAGGSAERLWNTVSAIMPPADCRARWVVKLDKAGFAVSTGSACSSGREKASHVLSAMGIASGDTDRALRFSGGWETSRNDWIRLAEQLIRTHRQTVIQASRAAAVR